jgi:hypothetical protein
MQAFGYHPTRGAYAIDWLPRKILDNQTKKEHNTIMCMNIRFVTAVLITVGELRANGTFSINDITKRLREQVNSGEMAFVDRLTEDINGETTYLINHDEVKEVFHELRHFNILRGLQENLKPGGWMVYCNAAMTPILKPNPVPRISSEVSAVSTQTVSLSLMDRVQTYLKGRMGQSVTMKEIQSRFKDVPMRCSEWSEFVAGMYLSVDKSGTPSRHSVRMQ